MPETTTMLYFLYAFFAIMAIVLGAQSVQLEIRYKKRTTIIIILLAAGLLLNYLIIGFSHVVLPNSWQYPAHQFRMALQYLLSPWLVVSSLFIARRFQVEYVLDKRVAAIAAIVVMLLTGLAVQYVLSMELRFCWYLKQTRYELSDNAVASLISAATGFIILSISIALYATKEYSLLMAVTLVVMTGFGLMRLLTGYKTLLINDILDGLLLWGFYLAERDSLSHKNTTQ